jgi:hypothetical protein
MLRFVFIMALSSCLPTSASALTQLPSFGGRSLLEDLLGDGAITEDFESYSASTWVSVPSPLNSQTGLVVDGVSFSDVDDSYLWRIEGFMPANNPSQTLRSGSAIGVDFDVPVTAFGFNYIRTGFGAVATVTVFQTDDQTILGTEQISAGFQTVFMGFTDPLGIGRIEISSFRDGDLSTGIDVVTFGVPEPSTALLMGLGLIGLAARRR